MKDWENKIDRIEKVRLSKIGKTRLIGLRRKIEKIVKLLNCSIVAIA